MTEAQRLRAERHRLEAAHLRRLADQTLDLMRGQDKETRAYMQGVADNYLERARKLDPDGERG